MQVCSDSEIFSYGMSLICVFPSSDTMHVKKDYFIKYSTKFKLLKIMYALYITFVFYIGASTQRDIHQLICS